MSGRRIVTFKDETKTIEKLSDGSFEATQVITSALNAINPGAGQPAITVKSGNVDFGSGSVAASGGLSVSAGLVNLGTGPVQIGASPGAQPVASVSLRGQIWVTRAAPGAADTVEICLKLADNSYSWVTLI